MKKAIIIILIIAVIGTGIYFWYTRAVVRFFNFKYGGSGIVPSGSLDFFISYKGKNISGTIKKDSPTATALSESGFNLTASYEGGKYVLAITDSSGIVKGYEIDGMSGAAIELKKGKIGS